MWTVIMKRVLARMVRIRIVIVNGTTKPWRNEDGFVIMGMKDFLLNSLAWSMSGKCGVSIINTTCR